MHFIIGRPNDLWYSVWSADGAIGFIYDSIFGAIISYVLFGIFCALAVIGLKTVLKRLLFGKKEKKKY